MAAAAGASPPASTAPAADLSIVKVQVPVEQALTADMRANEAKWLSAVQSEDAIGYCDGSLGEVVSALAGHEDDELLSNVMEIIGAAVFDAAAQIRQRGDRSLTQFDWVKTVSVNAILKISVVAEFGKEFVGEGDRAKKKLSALRGFIDTLIKQFTVECNVYPETRGGTIFMVAGADPSDDDVDDEGEEGETEEEDGADAVEGGGGGGPGAAQ